MVDFSSIPIIGSMFYDPSSDKANAKQALEAGQDAWGNVKPVNYQPVNYVAPTEANDIRDINTAVERADAASTGPTQLGNIKTNPEMQKQQAQQLAALSELSKGGMSAQDKANLAQIQQEENANERGNREAIMAAQARRGQASGGNSLLAQLTSGQSSANRQSAADMNVAGQAGNRAINAGQAAAGLAGQMHGQEYGEAANAAAAQDAIAKFNAGNTQQTNLANAAAQNAGNKFNTQNTMGTQQYNTGKHQDVLNAAAQAQNAGQTMNQFTMPSANFGQQAQQAGGIAGAGQAMSNYYQGNLKNNSQAQGNILGSATQIGAQYMKNNAGTGGAGGAGGAAGAGGGTMGGAFGEGAGAASMEGGMETAAIAAHGGKIPGIVSLGDFLSNDKVPALLQPGEVVVPHTLAEQGNPHQIAKFVKDGPSVNDPEQKKIAMLSALKHMRKQK